ncbi:type II secretion system F family protein [Mariniblastus fucicola]|uniref:Type IV pilin biogenesis protein n=1 Tax=Mariniblastus fucicola TaxID=980251 RepID=A0A5B9P2F3_9BACT|nr:hypothetical protein [Mariniblastus fucicola]QEG20518.1 type IV pilin biogenesis protein [Mariniblastus fucicola]
MTTRPDNLIQGKMSIELPIGLLDAKWDQIAAAASRIADEVDIKSEGLSGSFRKQTLAISYFFRNRCDYHRALDLPCVLAIVNPLASLADKDQLSDADIATAVHIGLCTLSRHGSNHRNLLHVFLYPILLTYFVAIGAIFASHFVLVPFQQMYAEFGIALPWLTDSILFLGYLTRTYTSTILLVIFGLPPLLWLLNWIGHEQREPGMSRLDVMLARKRPTVARWLLHVSLLIEAGLTNDDAVEHASRFSGKRWINRLAATHNRAVESDSAVTPNEFFKLYKFSMADTALAAPRSRGKVTLMQQVATWYRDSSSSIIEWFVQLLIPFYVLAILVGFMIVIGSLLLPVFAVISGLTGGGGPGGFM